MENLLRLLPEILLKATGHRVVESIYPSPTNDRALTPAALLCPATLRKIRQTILCIWIPPAALRKIRQTSLSTVWMPPVALQEIRQANSRTQGSLGYK